MLSSTFKPLLIFRRSVSLHALCFSSLLPRLSLFDYLDRHHSVRASHKMLAHTLSKYRKWGRDRNYNNFYEFVTRLINIAELFTSFSLANTDAFDRPAEVGQYV